MTRGDPNLLLIGLRGSGKSTLARTLASALDRQMIDLDESLLARFDDCSSISEVFERFGEAAFRQAEFEALHQALADHTGAIIALGGGTPTAPGAAELMTGAIASGEARVVYLRCQPEILRQRLLHQSQQQRAGRPLLTGDDSTDEIEQVFLARDDLYKKLATRTLDNVASIDEAVAQLAGWTDW